MGHNNNISDLLYMQVTKCLYYKLLSRIPGCLAVITVALYKRSLALSDKFGAIMHLITEQNLVNDFLIIRVCSNDQYLGKSIHTLHISKLITHWLSLEMSFVALPHLPHLCVSNLIK